MSYCHASYRQRQRRRLEPRSHPGCTHSSGLARDPSPGSKVPGASGGGESRKELSGYGWDSSRHRQLGDLLSKEGQPQPSHVTPSRTSSQVWLSGCSLLAQRSLAAHSHCQPRPRRSPSSYNNLVFVLNIIPQATLGTNSPRRGRVLAMPPRGSSV